MRKCYKIQDQKKTLKENCVREIGMDMRVILKFLLKYYLELSSGRTSRGFLSFMGSCKQGNGIAACVAGRYYLEELKEC